MSGNLTAELGEKISLFPNLEFRYSVLLLNSLKEDFACSEEILMLISMLSAQNIFY